MLVLSRKNQESVVLAGSGILDRPIKITVLAIASGKVKLGFEADPSIPVYRAEIWERMCASGEIPTPLDESTVPLRLD